MLHRIALFALAVGLLPACSNRENGTQDKSASNATLDPTSPKRGGVLTVGTVWLPYMLDPISVNHNPSIWFLQLINDQLVRVRKDGLGVEPGLAESWDISPNGLVYTFHLRPNLEFSDGEKLRASDVKFSLLRAAKDPSSVSGDLYPAFEVETPDDRTCILKLQAPWPAALATLALYTSSIIPEAYFKRVGSEIFSKAPIGAGPFVLGEIRNEQHAILKRNARHWDAERPYLDEVRYIKIADDLTRMLKLEAGEIDVADDVPISQVEPLRRTPGITVDSSYIMVSNFLILNPREKVFRDLKVRQAIHWAIDRDALSRVVFAGNAEVSTSFMPRMLYSAPVPFHQDLQKARQLLAESSSPQGLSARLLILPGTGIDEQLATVVQSQLERIGVHLELERVDFATLLNRTQRGEYEAILGIDSTSDTIDPSQYVHLLAVSTGMCAKWLGVDNPRADELALKAKVESNSEKRAEQYLEIQHLMRDDAIMIGLIRPYKRTALRDYVHGFAIAPSANFLFQNTWKTP